MAEYNLTKKSLIFSYNRYLTLELSNQLAVFPIVSESTPLALANDFKAWRVECQVNTVVSILQSISIFFTHLLTVSLLAAPKGSNSCDK